MSAEAPLTGARAVSPRNPRAVARALRERAEIRRVWLELVRAEPFERVTARILAARLPFRLSISALHWHMRHIRLEACLAEPQSVDGPL
jgi:hypothetical protein